ncbi:MAG: WG repeat-containing protein [Marinilabiliaceae bacterium]|nr:WG repeat-containing protein [Marinilabiliaceae bacterium]
MTKEITEIFPKVERKYGFADAQGNEVTPCIYSYASEFKNGYAVVVDHERQYRKFIDATGKVIFALECDFAFPPRQGKTIFRKNGKWGVIDIITKKVIVPCNEYDEIEWFDEDLRSICIGTMKATYGALDDEENDIETEYIMQDTDQELFFKVQKNEKWGLLDHKGKIILECQYHRIVMCNIDWKDTKSISTETFYLEVRKDYKSGAFDLNGKLILSCKYYSICAFRNNDDISKRDNLFFIIEKGCQKGIVTVGGKEVIPCEYYSIYRTGNELILEVQKDGKLGLLDIEKWNLIVNCEYDKIVFQYDEDDDNWFYNVKKDGKWEIIMKK